MTDARSTLTQLVFGSFLAVLVACGDDAPESTSTGETSAGPSTSSAGSGGGGGAGGGTDGGGGAGGALPGCETAPLLEITDANQVAVATNFAAEGGSIFYRVHLEADTWYAVLTDTSESGIKRPDTVVQVRTASGELLATDDEVYPFRRNDSEIYYRAVEAGEHCVEVLDYGSWIGNPTEPVTTPFEVKVTEIEPYPFVNLDTEPNDEPALAVPLGQTGAYHDIVLGRPDGPNDVDLFSFTKPAGVTDILVNLPPIGTGGPALDGFGATQPSRVSLLAADGVTVIARVDDTSSLGAACNPHFSCFLQARMPAAESQLYLRFEGPAAPEANDHYVAIVELFSGGYDVEPASDELEDVNDTAASALALDVVGTEPGLVRYVLWGGMHAGDEDWWIVGGDAADAFVSVTCFAHNQGSGVIGLTIEAFTLASGGVGNPIAAAVETPGEFPIWDTESIATAPPLPGGEPYLMKVSAQDLDPSIALHGYRCIFERTLDVN